MALAALSTLIDTSSESNDAGASTEATDALDLVPERHGVVLGCSE